MRLCSEHQHSFCG